MFGLFDHVAQVGESLRGFQVMRMGTRVVATETQRSNDADCEQSCQELCLISAEAGKKQLSSQT